MVHVHPYIVSVSNKYSPQTSLNCQTMRFPCVKCYPSKESKSWETLTYLSSKLQNVSWFFNLLHQKAGSDIRCSPLLPFTPPPLSSTATIFSPNELHQLGSPSWCCALLGGTDSWIIPQAPAADYQQRSHQGLPGSPPPPHFDNSPIPSRFTPSLFSFSSPCQPLSREGRLLQAHCTGPLDR